MIVEWQGQYVITDNVYSYRAEDQKDITWQSVCNSQHNLIRLRREGREVTNAVQDSRHYFYIEALSAENRNRKELHKQLDMH